MCTYITDKIARDWKVDLSSTTLHVLLLHPSHPLILPLDLHTFPSYIPSRLVSIMPSQPLSLPTTPSYAPPLSQCSSDPKPCCCSPKFVCPQTSYALGTSLLVPFDHNSLSLEHLGLPAKPSKFRLADNPTYANGRLTFFPLL